MPKKPADFAIVSILMMQSRCYCVSKFHIKEGAKGSTNAEYAKCQLKAMYVLTVQCALLLNKRSRKMMTMYVSTASNVMRQERRERSWFKSTKESVNVGMRAECDV
mmetsp:Transcript_28700/g.48844  ORF Transcript_28700/g.48844 Transcript_28700/m.48844 type:complete len:106 (+) Transcript_28700:434-751(+)